jgi:hypothetical protein
MNHVIFTPSAEFFCMCVPVVNAAIYNLRDTRVKDPDPPSSVSFGLPGSRSDMFVTDLDPSSFFVLLCH